jgi:hypothetical protein
MAIDDIPVQQDLPMGEDQSSGYAAKFGWVFVILAGLAVGELYTLHRMSTLHDQLTAQQNQLRENLTAQFQAQVSDRLTALEHQNAQELEAVKTELDKASQRMGSQGGELRRARALVTQLQGQQQAQTEQLKHELAQKADQQQVGALTHDVSTTKADLDTTKKAVSTLSADLGMARSELGTLIARNHDDIEYLRKLGDHDYYEFTLAKNQPSRVAGVGLTLKKVNPKRYTFNIAVLEDDILVERKECSINAPVIFYVNGSKKPYELVVNSVESNQVKGYVSTSKGAIEVAAGSEGAR